ncbi:hypothetical protein BO82DRAFT_93935 [Aspergillus uvarum CBS 121591]|uniref:Uncharacterized protein n=1 Tax=Aspergillus uvarum CBS 121591 TaxID=1448315 RepID=A0A319CC83_9EURO|nr:hypothetical protein BO82DRAFT_93935 [Aspergillus uvarum CBS 121591]PYH81361.1 hypothetical protein BO82DRAFT_93935 [Aspergillus uvarum CBS 121591]
MPSSESKIDHELAIIDITVCFLCQIREQILRSDSQGGGSAHARSPNFPTSVTPPTMGPAKRCGRHGRLAAKGSVAWQILVQNLRLLTLHNTAQLGLCCLRSVRSTIHGECFYPSLCDRDSGVSAYQPIFDDHPSILDGDFSNAASSLNVATLKRSSPKNGSSRFIDRLTHRLSSDRGSDCPAGAACPSLAVTRVTGRKLLTRARRVRAVRLE